MWANQRTIILFSPKTKRNPSETEKTMAFQSLINGKFKHYKQKAKGIITTTETAKSTTILTQRSISMEEDDFEDCANETTPLQAIAEAFEDLSGLIKTKGFDFDLSLKPFCDACSLVSELFKCLGFAFKFAELEYVHKVHDLEEAASTFGTLNRILDVDVQNDTVKTQGSRSRNLRRVRQGLDLIRALFQNFISADDYSLKEAASTAYYEVCAPFHTWAVRTAVSAGMCTLPTKEQLLLKLNETDDSAEKVMRRYINASLSVIEYVDNLYISRNISLDW